VNNHLSFNDYMAGRFREAGELAEFLELATNDYLKDGDHGALRAVLCLIFDVHESVEEFSSRTGTEAAPLRAMLNAEGPIDMLVLYRILAGYDVVLGARRAEA
jgi:hypothetical protein